ncbi:MAG: hypothetical protein J7647_04100 [Cyanobacteria bacterium SBLK]|nr:hypothetical protein [Cyanobacteria bacterium SBLK]
MSPDRVTVLPNTFDAEQFQPAPNAPYLLQRYGLKPEQPVILTVTRLGKTAAYKGCDRVLHASCQISVMLENRSDLVSFCPSELMLVQKAIVQSLYQIGDVVVIDFQEPASVEGSDRCWHGYWGLVRSVSEVGVVEVDVGKRQLSVFSYDLKSVYTSASLSANIEPSRDVESSISHLKEIVEQILKLRGEDLDDLETNMLNFLQRRVEFTERQLQHLEYLLSLYF